jgi:hypothetical protein
MSDVCSEAVQFSSSAVAMGLSLNDPRSIRVNICQAHLHARAGGTQRRISVQWLPSYNKAGIRVLRLTFN